MKRTYYLELLIILFGVFSLSAKQPNIVLIMCDDMGYSDLGCYGGEIETPNIDKLAKGGVRLQHFKNTGRCCPSRVSLMTGRYSHAAGMGWMTGIDEGRPGYRGQISFETPTVAEILKDAGYETYMTGKWHITLDGSFWAVENAKPNGSWPFQRGFDHSFGGLGGGEGYYFRSDIFENDQRIPTEELANSWYYTHAITQAAKGYIEGHAFDEKPLFMYVAHYAPHRPLEAPESRIQKVMDRYRVGYDILRKRRFERMKALGLVKKKSQLRELDVEYDGNRIAWTELSSDQQAQWIREMATYAAMVEIMDDGIGELLDSLEAKDQLDNTIVVFISDNGATKEGGVISQLAADLSNTPFRSYKKYVHEGGISSPFIIHWANGLQGQAGSLQPGLAHISDILPTLVDLVNAETVVGEDVSFDGTSLVPTIRGEVDLNMQRELYFEHEGHSAVIADGWKLVSKGEHLNWELYDYRNDAFEEHDLVEQNPKIAERLKDKWMNWGNNNHVFPREPLNNWGKRQEKYIVIHPDQSGTKTEKQNN